MTRAIDFFFFSRDGQTTPYQRFPDDEFKIRLNAPTRPLESFRSECIRTATSLQAAYGSDLVLCLSGGLDSEAVAESLIAAKAKFRIVIARFPRDLNEHDIAWARRFCDEKGLRYELRDLDPREFLLSPRFDEMRTAIANPFPKSPTTFALFERIWREGGVPVAGAGEPTVKGRADGILYLSEDSRNFGLDQFCLHAKTPAEPAFFRNNPEIFHAFLASPALRPIRNARYHGPLATGFRVAFKKAVYLSAFALPDREKYHGYENFARAHPELMPLLFPPPGSSPEAELALETILTT